MFYWPFQGGTSFVDLLCFCSVLCLLCLCARLFICALWSPAGKGLTSWLSFVVSTVSLSLSHWYPGSGMVLDCIDSWSLHLYLLFLTNAVHHHKRNNRIKLTHYDDTKKIAHGSQIVRGKENLKLSYGRPIQQQASSTNQKIKALCQSRR